jgi:TetR/AcrR family transcriptional regulator, transcriptional repressor for nem operon
MRREMADSVEIPRRRRPGKRERLVSAACEVMYAQGVEKTTLADIASAAEVPLGNVYYYFKTKGDLLHEVIETRLGEVREALAGIDQAHERPADRLKALFGALAVRGDLIARYGCPSGSLASELAKRDESPPTGADLLRVPVEWTERQFRVIGRADARDLALQIIARYQGAALLASTLRDPSLLVTEGSRVAEWIDELLTDNEKTVTVEHGAAPRRADGVPAYPGTPLKASWHWSP